GMVIGTPRIAPKRVLPVSRGGVAERIGRRPLPHILLRRSVPIAVVEGGEPVSQQDEGATDSDRGCLDGVRVVEIADEQGEYTGLLLRGLGAEVIKVEPPGG